MWTILLMTVAYIWVVIHFYYVYSGIYIYILYVDQDDLHDSVQNYGNIIFPNIYIAVQCSYSVIYNDDIDKQVFDENCINNIAIILSYNSSVWTMFIASVPWLRTCWMFENMHVCVCLFTAHQFLSINGSAD